MCKPGIQGRKFQPDRLVDLFESIEHFLVSKNVPGGCSFKLCAECGPNECVKFLPFWGEEVGVLFPLPRMEEI
jgi:hypothetical protein